MVLLDAQPTEAFEGLAAYPAFYSAFRRISALLPSLARLGVGRLVPPMVRCLSQHATSSISTMRRRLYRSLRDEFGKLPTSLAQAQSFQSLGDRPLVFVTATRDAQARWLPLQEGWRDCQRTAAIASCPTRMVHWSRIAPQQKRRRRPFVTSCTQLARDGS